jgi:hypothetical protein
MCLFCLQIRGQRLGFQVGHASRRSADPRTKNRLLPPPLDQHRSARNWFRFPYVAFSFCVMSDWRSSPFWPYCCLATVVASHHRCIPNTICYRTQSLLLLVECPCVATDSSSFYFISFHLIPYFYTLTLLEELVRTSSSTMLNHCLSSQNITTEVVYLNNYSFDTYFYLQVQTKSYETLNSAEEKRWKIINACNLFYYIIYCIYTHHSTFYIIYIYS